MDQSDQRLRPAPPETGDEAAGTALPCSDVSPNSNPQSPPRMDTCVDCWGLQERPALTAGHPEWRSHDHRPNGDPAAAALFSPYVAALVVSAEAVILDIDHRSAAFLGAGRVLSCSHNRIGSPNPEFNGILLRAISRAAHDGQAKILVCPSHAAAPTRYIVLLGPNRAGFKVPGPLSNVTCLVFPLGRRRMASARQLMSMFDLSAAEARLARALCHGETLEEFAIAQGVKLPTVKTQLRSIFAKTLTDRQVTLVALIAGIPPLR